MPKERIVVDAMWDEDAHVFVATSTDVPGLVAEAETLEALQQKLANLIPELLELDGATKLPQAEAELVLCTIPRQSLPSNLASMPDLKTERVLALMSRPELDAVDDWRFANRVKSRGEAIRQLVKLGLECSAC